MSTPTPPPPAAPRSHFNNWISAIGGVLAVGALFSFALLVWMDFTQGDTNPYLGIFTYIVAPGFLITGLGLVFFGAWAQRRWAIKHAATMPDKWRLDFHNPAQRRLMFLFGTGAVGFIMLSAFGSYQTYHYSESVQFCGEAQTPDGGWGYVSAKDGNNFDEGSTCVTQMQGLRACRNAGIPVPKEVIDRGVEYIRKCTTPNGGVQYSIRGGGERPPITAAAVACLFSSGEYESDLAKLLLKFCEKNITIASNGGNFFGHWHYAHFYYAQVVYRQGDAKWNPYFNELSQDILRKQSADGSWKEGHVGPVYTTAINATILQIANGYLPIYER